MGDETSGLPAFIDNPHAPEVFAAGAPGFLNLGGNVVITFETLVGDHSPEPSTPRRVVVSRLVLPAAGAHGLAVGLFDFMKAQGLIPETPPGSIQ
jgi:hypothetical protein